MLSSPSLPPSPLPSPPRLQPRKNAFRYGLFIKRSAMSFRQANLDPVRGKNFFHSNENFTPAFVFPELKRGGNIFVFQNVQVVDYALQVSLSLSLSLQTFQAT